METAQDWGEHLCLCNPSPVLGRIQVTNDPAHSSLLVRGMGKKKIRILFVLLEELQKLKSC